MTYKHFIENIVKEKINVLILDIEGHEKHVLETFKELKDTQFPEILVVECGLLLYASNTGPTILDQLSVFFSFIYFIIIFFIVLLKLSTNGA